VVITFGNNFNLFWIDLSRKKITMGNNFLRGHKAEINQKKKKTIITFSILSRKRRSVLQQDSDFQKDAIVQRGPLRFCSGFPSGM
jgi:hypothetical protein